jgi:hypothetical protein
MKSRDENKMLLDESVKRLMAYPLAKRKQIFLKGMAMSVAKSKDKRKHPAKSSVN